MKKNKNWINGMDSLRFVLALIVLLSHLDNPFVKVFNNSETNVGKYAAAILANSFNGIGAVIAFFIISGFVVHYPVKDTELNIRKFFIRRWVRIGIPLVIISSVAIYYHQFVLIPIWSLYCELIYYTIYPILRKIQLSWVVKCQIAYLLQITIVILFCQNDILSLIYQKDVNYFGTYWQLGDFMTWIIGLPIWLLGVLIAEKIDILSVKIKDITFKELSIYRISIFTLGVTLHVLKFHFFLSDIIILNVFALLMVKWIEREIVFYKTHKSIKILEFGGQFSYSLYLCHGLCVLFLSYFMEINIYTYFIYIFLSVLVSYGVFLIIEKPSHKLAQNLANIKLRHKKTA